MNNGTSNATQQRLFACESTFAPDKVCSTNSSCYFSARVTKDFELLDETSGCTNVASVCQHFGDDHPNWIQRCCNDGNFCNRALRHEAKINTKKRSTSVNETFSTTQQYAISVSAIIFVFVVITALVFALWFKKYRTLPSKTGSETTLENAVISRNPTAVESPKLAQRTAVKDLKLFKLIGEGSFGQVFLADYKKSNVAVKVFASNCGSSYEFEKRVYEFGAMKDDRVLRCIFSDFVIESGVICNYVIVTEYCSFGSLRYYLENKTVNDQLCAQMSRDIAAGLAYLHREIVGDRCGKPAIAHRDIKSNNILLNSQLKCVIGDFGFAVLEKTDNTFGLLDRVDSNSNAQLVRKSRTTSAASSFPTMEESLTTSDMVDNVFVGTLRYMAPEILSKTINAKDFNAFRQSDMYSFALVMWEIGMRTTVDDSVVTPYSVPYYEFCDERVSLNALKMYHLTIKYRPTIPDHWSKSKTLIELRKLITECWKQQPESRLTATRCHKNLEELIELQEKEF